MKTKLMELWAHMSTRDKVLLGLVVGMLALTLGSTIAKVICSKWLAAALCGLAVLINLNTLRTIYNTITRSIQFGREVDMLIKQAEEEAKKINDLLK